MADRHHLLFGQIFIDYIKAIFFTTDKKFTWEEMTEAMPDFYRDKHMVSGAIHILLMNEQILQLNTNGTEYYYANPQAIMSMKTDIENERLNKEIDIDIKRRTRDSLKWQRWPMKYWYVIMFMSAGLSAGVTKILERPKSQAYSILSLQEIQALIDSSVNHRMNPVSK